VFGSDDGSHFFEIFHDCLLKKSQGMKPSKRHKPFRRAFFWMTICVFVQERQMAYAWIPLIQPRPNKNAARRTKNQISHVILRASAASIEWDENDEHDDEILLVYDDDAAVESWAPSTDTNQTYSPLTLDQLSQPFMANVSYFYLRNELGLSDVAMWRITHEASSALAMSTDVIRHKINVLRDLMDLSDENIRTLLEIQPAILHLSADKNIAPTILYLLRALDLGRDDLRKLVMGSSSVLSYNIQTLQSKISFFTNTMGFSVDETRSLLVREPRLLRASVDSGLKPRMYFFTKEIEIPMMSLRTIILKNPKILLYSVEQNLIPKIVFHLIMKLQMSEAHVEKLLLSYPQFLDHNLERSIQPKTQFLLLDLGFTVKETRSVFMKFPRLVTYSLRKIKHVVGFFRYEVGMSAAQVKSVIRKAPGIIGLATDTKIRKKVDFLQSSLGLSDRELRNFIAAMPNLLNLDKHNNLIPKLDYLKNFFNTDDGLRDAILRCPTLLAYSLENRIRPRMEAMQQSNIDPQCITNTITMTQKNFDEWILRHTKKKLFPSGPRKTLAKLALKPETEDILSGKIKHWTRERRPPAPPSLKK
jgi:mTERF domain-containing protein